MSAKEVGAPPFLARMYEWEIEVNRNIQQHLILTDYILQPVNALLDPRTVLDLWLPLCGALSHKLLARLVVSVGILNTVASLCKWTLPAYRPIWWVQEFNGTYRFQDLNIEANTCDTSAGFPSSHAVAFTAFAFIVLHSWTSRLGRHCFLRDTEVYVITHGLMSLPLSVLLCSRLYFLTEFLHQGLGGVFIAMVGLHMMHRHTSSILKWRTFKTCLAVLLAGCVPIAVYFAMLQLDEDPHWSVRLAFKWCPDPSTMRHEVGPIFTLFRDFGYVLGIALSCPLFHNYKNNRASFYKRLPALAIVVVLNAVARHSTPKHLGRWVFLGYELTRNCIQSYTLLTIIPKLVK